MDIYSISTRISLAITYGESTRLGLIRSKKYILHRTQLDPRRPYYHVGLLNLDKIACVVMVSLNPLSILRHKILYELSQVVSNFLNCWTSL